MNHNEIDITRLVNPQNDNFVPFDLSNNRATLGDNAGKLTWQASKEAAIALKEEDSIDLLPTDEHKEAFRDFVRDSGGWDKDEIAAWDDVELHALLLQWIAGDIREAFDDEPFAQWDWEQYQEDSEAGRVSSRIWRTDDGKVIFYIGS